jgi:hypothetical protein
MGSNRVACVWLSVKQNMVAEVENQIESNQINVAFSQFHVLCGRTRSTHIAVDLGASEGRKQNLGRCGQ